MLLSADLALRRGECVVVLGPNGVGKSSLLRAAAGDHGALASGTRNVTRAYVAAAVTHIVDVVRYLLKPCGYEYRLAHSHQTSDPAHNDWKHLNRDVLRCNFACGVLRVRPPSLTHR